MNSKCSKFCPPSCSFTVNYCEYRVFCEDYDCTNPETCVQMIPSDCVIYEGNLLEPFGIAPGTSVTDIIIALAELVYPGCTTTTTTTTIPV